LSRNLIGTFHGLRGDRSFLRKIPNSFMYLRADACVFLLYKASPYSSLLMIQSVLSPRLA